MLKMITFHLFPRLAQWLGIPALLRLHRFLGRLGVASPLAPAYCRAH